MSEVDCIIVGGGFAGLVAGARLVEQGRRVLLLEARVRLGGRCQTGVYEGEALDFGGHWIGAHQPRIRKMISDMGLVLKPQYDAGVHILQIFQQKYQYSGNISSLNTFGEVLKEMQRHVATWDADMMLVPLDDPTKSPKAREFDGMTLREWQVKNVKGKEVELLMNFLLWTIFTVTADEVSYMWWLYYLRQGHGYSVLSDIRGGAQENKVEGGCQQICETLADRIGRDKIILRCAAQRIEQHDDGVVVVCNGGRVYKGRYVIVTAPPQVCQEIAFVPSLPFARMELHKHFTMGSVIKFYVLYRTHWWREKGLSGELLTDGEPVTLMYDATTEKVPGFIGFIPAHIARKWMDVPADELKRAIIKQLVEAFGPEAAHPKEVIIRPWGPDDVWSRGGYAGSMGPNVLSRYGDILRRPVGRVHWACSELALDWCGYFEGAVEAGERVAGDVNKLLGNVQSRL